MNKQEKVKNSIITNIAKACPNLPCETAADLADDILKDEAVLGVMIQGTKFQMRITTKDPWQTYYEVEPLIEVKK